MMGKLWWERLVNSVRFLDETEDALRYGRSVLLCFETEIPWEEVMLETLEQRLLEMTDSRAFNIHDVSGIDKPGEFLLEEYCRKEGRNDYWPTTHGSPECFLAQNKETLLNNRYVCLKGITPATAAKWAASVAEYTANCDEEREHGLFILLVNGTVPSCPKELTWLKYSDYVSDYDCMMLCLTIISDISCSRAEKMYLCEVASNIADNKAELAGLLASEKLELIRDPYDVTARVYRELSLDMSELKAKVEAAVWEAQLKIVFPKIENFRADLIRKYETALQIHLPIRTKYDKIEKASDLEIGELFHICKENKVGRITTEPEYKMLKKMKDARNTLAHWETLTYKELKDLGMI